MKNFFFTLFLLFQLTAYSQTNNYSRVRVFFDGKPIAELASKGIECDHGLVGSSYWEGDLSADELSRVQSASFRTEILIQDVVSYYRNQLAATQGSRDNGDGCGVNPASYPVPQHFSFGSMGGYFTYQEILDNLDLMAQQYPILFKAKAEISNIYTHENRPIYWVKISDNPTQDETGENEVLYTGVHHAREPGSVTQMIFFMWYLLENYSTDSDIQTLVNNLELYFVPCINPDGYIYNQTTNPQGGGMWRKNRRDNGDGTYGVDLNRNYGYNWGADNIGSSPFTYYDTYRGPSPFSEPETQNIRDFCNTHQFVTAFNYHTYSDLLIVPGVVEDLSANDLSMFRDFSEVLIKDNLYSYGVSLETVAYDVNGNSDDWMYGEQTTKPKSFSWTPETGETDFGFWPPTTEIVRHCRENISQNIMLARIALNTAIAEDISEPFTNTISTQADFSLQQYGFNSGTFEVSVLPFQNIASTGASKTYNLALQQKIIDNIAVQLSPSIAPGDDFSYILKVTTAQGQVIKDTITRSYGDYDIVYQNDFNSQNLSSWTFNSNFGNNWGTEGTAPDFYLTESPGGFYITGETSTASPNISLNLSGYIKAVMTYRAAWHLQPNTVYVATEASYNNGASYEPLCGKYTQFGSSNQLYFEPIYDGQQRTWVREQLPLQTGNNFNFRFEFGADGFERDGMKIDDIKIYALSPTVNIHNSTNPKLGLQVFPNPASDLLNIKTNTITNGVFTLYSSLGQMANTSVFSQSNLFFVDISNLPSGVYFYEYKTATGTENGKVVIGR